MTVYAVTTDNWNSPTFWSGVSEGSGGHALDFSALPPGYTVETDAAGGTITISDGSGTFTIGESGVGGTDANLGAGTALDYFTLQYGGGGGDALAGTGSADFIDGDAGDDTIAGGGGHDTIDGGEGGDSLSGGAGDDVITGGITAADTDLYLDWSAAAADEADISGGFTQDTGGIDVTVTYTDDGNGQGMTVESTSAQYVGSGEPFDTRSAAQIDGGGWPGDTATVRMDFEAVDGSGFRDEVTDVSFRINDVDEAWGSGWDDQVTIRAYDAQGNELDVTVTYQGAIETSTAPTVDGDGSHASYSSSGSVMVEVEGPVSHIEIDYDQLGYGGQIIWVTDVHFTAVGRTDGDDAIDGGDGDDTLLYGDGENTVRGGDGDDFIDDEIGAILSGADHLDGGAGNDTIYGGGGDDTLIGGTGADALFGETGDDRIVVDQGDTAWGGDGDDTFTLTDEDTTGSGAISIIGGEGDETQGDTLVLTPDVSHDDITFTSTDDAAGGLSGSFTMADGTYVEFSEIENIICFTPGTLILTELGERPIETLRPGERVVTRDSGLQRIRWIGRRTVPGRGRFAPVRVAPSVMDGARKGLLVSPQHRILFTGYQAQLLFGQDEVLVSAKHLIDGADVCRQEVDEVTYIHLMFDHHEIIYAEGIATESFHAGDIGLSAVCEAAREELFALFPELRTAPRHHGDTARQCLRQYEARLLAERTRFDRQGVA